MLALFLVILFIPYAMATGVLDRAYQTLEMRAGIRKDVLVALAGSAYVLIFQDRLVLMKSGVMAMLSISNTVSFGGDIAIPLLIMSYVSVQFIKIGFLNKRGDLNLVKFGIFTLIMGSVFFYSLINIDIKLFGYQLFSLFIMSVGVVSCVFVSGLHTIFSRQILIVNALGAIAGFFNSGVMTRDDFFIILKLLPKFPENYNIIIVIISTVSAVYSLCIERGLVRPPLTLAG